MLMIELATKTATADSRIGSHNSERGTTDTSSVIRGEWSCGRAYLSAGHIRRQEGTKANEGAVKRREKAVPSLSSGTASVRLENYRAGSLTGAWFSRRSH